MSLRSFVLLCSVGMLVSVGVTGCPPSSTSKTVLAGTWVLEPGTSPNSNLGQILLTFDSSGNLSDVSFVFSGATVTATNLSATTSVSGSTVTITSTFGTNANSSLSFTGTLNSTDTVITGTSSFTFVTDSTTITFPTGAATLTKQGTTPITGNATNGQTLFSSECASCHTAEALAPSASAIVSNLGSINAAMSGITLTDQQIADLQAYLATVTSVTGDATAGQTLFTDECASCHTAAALKPAASSIVSDLGTINAAMSGIDLSAQQIADLQAYLATQ